MSKDTTPAEPTPKWTQDEAVAFECAREVITDMRAILTGEIAEESSKEHPDAERLERLHAESSRLFRERAGLHVKDHDAIARVRAEYGARVRAWRAGTSDLSYRHRPADDGGMYFLLPRDEHLLPSLPDKAERVVIAWPSEEEKSEPSAP